MYLDERAPCPPRCHVHRDVVNAPPPPTTPRPGQARPARSYPATTRGLSVRDVRDGAIVGNMDVESSGAPCQHLRYLLPCEFASLDGACGLGVPVRPEVHGHRIALLHHAGFLGEVRLREGLVRCRAC